MHGARDAMASPPTRPCAVDGCHRTMTAQADANTTADGWFFTTTRGRERRDWTCDHPSEFHTMSEVRETATKEKAK
jgi:hypothetical protein